MPWTAVPSGRSRTVCVALVFSVLAVLAPGVSTAQTGSTPEQTLTGQQPPGDDAEIIGGEPADPGADPWMAALVLEEEPNPFLGLICGGSLISPDTVVTAAHCVDGAPPGALDVVVGTIDLLPTSGQRIAVRSYRIHPDFYGPRQLDLAVLQLAQDAVGATPIEIVLPSEGALWPDGTSARFTGWGADERQAPVSRLQAASAPIIGDTDCQSRYGRFFQADTMVCAGDIGPGPGTGAVSPCFGDSGGPMTVLDGARPVLIGLVAWGFRCGDPNYPAVFTEVVAATAFLTPYLDPDSPPGRVRGLRVRRVGTFGREARATWQPPLFDGGTEVTRYLITVQPGNRHLVAGPRATTRRIAGLRGRAPFRFTIAAQNSVGTGPPTTLEVAP